MSDILCQPCELLVCNVGPTNHRAIKSAAACAGITINALMRPSVKQIIDSYPEEMRLAPAPKNAGKRLHLRGINPLYKQQLENISSHVGVDVSALIKTDSARPELHKKKV